MDLDVIISYIRYLYHYLYNIVISTQMADFIYKMKLISLLISFVLIILSVFLFLKSEAFWRLKEFLSVLFSPLPSKRRMLKKWNSIMKMLETGNEANIKLAVIESDKLLDNVLEIIGYRGKSLGQKLQQLTTAQLSCLDEVWQAHKVRNNIVHQADFKLKVSTAKEAVEAFGKALRELEVL